MVAEAEVTSFLEGEGPIIDVRSPGEFRQGHIPGAHNISLFSDAERAVIGTLYKEKGKEIATLEGLKIVGPKLHHIALEGSKLSTDGKVRVHCWRGGMRSASVAWLMETAGLQATTLIGGYKAFRRFVLGTFSKPRQLKVIGGMTGVGKSHILEALNAHGEQILDLEAAASHRGSSYGGIGLAAQPSNEQFENLLAVQWHTFTPKRAVWVEDESRKVGNCIIPKPLFEQMQLSPLFIIEKTLEERIELLAALYGQQEAKAELLAATERLRKRLGGERTQAVLSAIEAGQFSQAAALLLAYYDGCYRCCLKKKEGPITTLSGQNLSSEQWAQQLIERTA